MTGRDALHGEPLAICNSLLTGRHGTVPSPFPDSKQRMGREKRDYSGKKCSGEVRFLTRERRVIGGYETLGLQENSKSLEK